MQRGVLPGVRLRVYEAAVLNKLFGFGRTVEESCNVQRGDPCCVGHPHLLRILLLRVHDVHPLRVVLAEHSLIEEADANNRDVRVHERPDQRDGRLKISNESYPARCEFMKY